MRPEQLQEPLEKHAQFLAVAEALETSVGLESELGRNALEGARQTVIESVVSIAGASEYLQNVLAETEASISRLSIIRYGLTEEGMSTDEVDQRLREKQEDPIYGLAQVLHGVGAPLVAKSTEVETVPEPAVAPTPQEPKTKSSEPTSAETGEDNRPVLNISFGINDKERPVILMKGSRYEHQFDLMGMKFSKADQDFGRPDIKLAVIKVLAEAREEGVAATDFKELVENELGYEITGSKDGRNALNTARTKVFEKMIWGKQKIFLTSGNGGHAKYRVNPILRVRPDFQISVDDIRSVQEIIEKKKSGIVELSGVDSTSVDQDDTTIDVERDLALLHERLPELPTVQEIVSLLALIDHRSVKLDQLLELADIPGNAASEFINKYEEWYENLDKLIGIDREMILTDTESANKSRLQTLESLLELIGSKESLEHVEEVLNNFKTDNVVVETLFDIVDTLVNMPDDDIEVLRAILVFQTGLAVREYKGSFSSGRNISEIDLVFEMNGRTFKYRNGDWKEVGEKTEGTAPESIEESFETIDMELPHDSDDEDEVNLESDEETDSERLPAIILDIREAIDSLAQSHIFGANGVVKSTDETISVRELKRLTPSRKIGTRESLLRAKSAGILKGRVPRNSSEFQKIGLNATEVVAIYLLNNHPDTVGNTGSRRKQRDSIAKIQKELEKFFDTIK